MFGMDKTRSGLLYCVARSSGLLIVVAVAALAYGFIRKNG